VIGNLGDFDGNKLQSLSKEGLKFGDEDEDTLKKRIKAYKETFKPLMKFLKDQLQGKVAKVTLSQRVLLPAIIVTSQYGHTANMERIMRAQTLSNPEMIKQMAAAKTLELNPRHPIIQELNNKVKADPTSEETKNLANLIYDAALLVSGFVHDDVDGFSSRLYSSVAKNLNIENMELSDDLPIQDEEEEENEEGADASSSSAGKDEF
jgi:heat shock protein beta